MKRNVLYITYHFPPCSASGVFRAIRFLKYLPEFNWQPVVLTIPPEDYSREIPRDEGLAKTIAATMPHLPVYKAPILVQPDRIIGALGGIFSRNSTAESTVGNHDRPLKKSSSRQNFWQHCKDLLTVPMMIPDKRNGWLPAAVWQGRSIIRKHDIRLIFASGGPWTALLIGTLLKKLSGCPLILDFRDPWTNNPYDSLPHPLRVRANAFLEKKCVTAADLVVCNTAALQSSLQQRYETDKFITITNGYDETEFTGMETAPRTSHSDNKRIVLHIGALYDRRSPETFLRALANLRRQGKISDADTAVHFIGRLALPDFDSLVRRLQLTRMVFFKEPVSKHQALRAMSQADILVLIQPQARLQIPAKFFEYLRIGKPIFAICSDGPVQDLICREQIGTTAGYDDIEAIQKNFMALLQQCGSWPVNHGGGASPELARTFEARNLTRNLAAQFDKIDDLVE